MKHVLVTGASGYLGSILCEHLLRDDFRVTALDNLYYNQSTLMHLCHNKNFNFVYGNATLENDIKPLLKDVDVIIPLAAIVGAPACNLNKERAIEINFKAIEMINRLRSRDQLVVYPNTNSGYGTKSGDMYCDEESDLEPISLYGRTKCDAEKLLLNSINTITFRLATVFGMSPRMRTDLLVNDFVQIALNYGYIIIFEKDFKRNYIHIRDVADCFIHAINNSEKMIGRPYNVGLDSANLSKEELVLKIKEYIPNLFIHFAEIGEDPDKRNYIVSNKRIKETGFEPKRSIDDGIMELIKGFRMLGRSPFKNI
ncbi:MAG: NAD(P)-dependent oxidoreductase [FCB group bacterium]|jgi:nucleoside-diphosphate-sugar epimerase